MPRHILFILHWSAFLLAVCQTSQAQDLKKLPPTASLPESSVRGEVRIYYWDDITGDSIEALTANETYPESPDLTKTVTELQGVTNRGDNYGSLVRGYILPPATGLYTFYVSGDDETEFWLSSSYDASQKSKIAAVPDWTRSLNYSKYSSQRSPAIELSADKGYYFEIIHKEAGGGDHFSVAWDGPGFSRKIISGQNIASYIVDSTSAPNVDGGLTSDLAYTNGFVGQYFQGRDFDRFLAARNDQTIYFQSSSGSFADGQPSDNFSARWYGEFTAPHPDGGRNYTFRVRTDDGFRLYVDGEKNLSAWRDQGASAYTTTVTFQPQQSVNLMMEYYEHGGAAVAQLSIIDDSTGAELKIGEVVRSPDLSVPSDTDSDGDGLSDTWELRNGLSPWLDDASEINNNRYTSVPTTPEPDTGTVTLSWTAPLTRVDGSSISLSEIQRYEIVYGDSPSDLSNTVVVGGAQTSAEISGLSSTTWYFSMKTVDTDGLKSENSKVLSHTVE